MTIDDARLLLPTRPCKFCGAVGVIIDTNPNNHGAFVRCPSCGESHCWDGVLFLKRSDKPRRPPVPSRLELETVWHRFDDHCCICDRHAFEIGSLCIGRQVHHAPSYAKVGHAGQGLPVCSRCHEFVNWRQRDVVVVR